MGVGTTRSSRRGRAAWRVGIIGRWNRPKSRFQPQENETVDARRSPSAARPAASCSPLEDTGAAHTCDAFAPPDAAACGDFDDYKYGLSDLADASLTNLYVVPFANSSARLARAVARWFEKDVRFLFGDADVCNCNTEGYANLQDATICYPRGATCAPNVFGGTLALDDDGGGNGSSAAATCCDTYPDSTTDNALATSCKALLQGSNRLQRGLNYMGSLGALHANLTAADNRSSSSGGGYAPTYGTFNGGHDNEAFYASALFADWALGVADGRRMRRRHR